MNTIGPLTRLTSFRLLGVHRLCVEYFEREGRINLPILNAPWKILSGSHYYVLRISHVCINYFLKRLFYYYTPYSVLCIHFYIDLLFVLLDLISFLHKVRFKGGLSSESFRQPTNQIKRISKSLRLRLRWWRSTFEAQMPPRCLSALRLKTLSGLLIHTP